MPASSSRERKKNIRRRDFNHSGVARKAKRNTQSKPKFDTKNEDDSVVQELGNRKRFHPADLISLKPKTLNQERFIRAYYDGTPLIAALGSAGSGKSFLSLYCALSEVFDPSSPYERVILLRSAVQGRDMGFLPGDLNERMAPYEAAYEGIIKEIMPQFKQGYSHLKSLGYLEFHSTSFLRSVTFHRSIIILSEAQNEDLDCLLTVTTRGDINSRVILEGDQRQSDMERNREKSGLMQFEKVMNNMPSDMVEKIQFEETDIVRGGLAREVIIAANRTL